MQEHAPDGTHRQDIGPQTEVGKAIFRQKYAMQGESFRDVCNRVASGLSDNHDHYHAFREILLTQRFLPGGRIYASIGTSKNVCSHNCFVSGTISDSFVDGPDSIMDRAKEAAATMRMGGGIGYDFSTLRPRGALIKRLQSNATGPISFMHIFDSIGLATCSSGHRRGAQMGILRVDHPDIEEFVHAKNNSGALTGFNISVAITDDFMRAVESGATEFPLVFDGQVHSTINPQQLWELIMRSAWDWAEPGVVFIDKMNAENNLWYRELIAATNPCSEQPLPPYGACLLGSFNLPKYIQENRLFDYTQLEDDIPHVVRAMDNVNGVAKYPLPEQRVEALNKRRMGLGVTGLANAIEAMGHPYGSDKFLSHMHTILVTLKEGAYAASAMLAKEKGPFPLFDLPLYMESPFIQRLSAEIKGMIEDYGIRNSHLISMAPTGTISLTADNVSSSIEPTFALVSEVLIHTPEDGAKTVTMQDYGNRVFGTTPKVSKDVTSHEHLNVLCAAQLHTDSAVSKTCNVPPTMPWDEFKELYHRAWRRGAKSCAVYNTGGKRGAALTAAVGDTCLTGTCDI
jgi:ribonucleoside-diphosphate reductase alpha chain